MAQIGLISQQKHGKITRPEPYKPPKVIIIVYVIRVSRLVIERKGSIVDANDLNQISGMLHIYLGQVIHTFVYPRIVRIIWDKQIKLLLSAP